MLLFVPRVLLYASRRSVVVLSAATSEGGLPISGVHAAALDWDQVTTEAMSMLIGELASRFTAGVAQCEVSDWLSRSRVELFRVARVRSWSGFYRDYDRSVSVGYNGQRWRLSELVLASDARGFVSGDTVDLGEEFNAHDIARRVFGIWR